MAVDVLNFPDLQDVERQIRDREKRDDMGSYHSGDQLSQKVGFGLEMDGLREYTPDDDPRHIDWNRTASQGDGTILWRKHYAERSPLTVLISDMPSEKYGGTMGDPASARSLGFIASNLIATSASNEHSPVMALWTGGHETNVDYSVFEGPNSAELALQNGFDIAIKSRLLAQEVTAYKSLSARKRRKAGDLILPDTESLADLVESSSAIAQRYAEVARFVIISGFSYGEGTNAVIDEMERLSTHNDVVAVQITHPLMREIPEHITEISRGDGTSYQIESDEQRRLYGEKASAEFKKVQDSLKQASSTFIELDTMDPRLSQLRT